MTKYEAILALHNQTNPNTGLTIKGKVEKLTGLEKVKSNGAKPNFTWEQVLAKEAELQADYEKQAYARARNDAYPSWQEQLDMQYWDKVNGTETWKKTIDAVKAKYPKSE